ncbi:MAG: CNP1-like family protein [Polaromonas sp.]|nr:CNP1-like family protein [Polaromonas sp.]
MTFVLNRPVFSIPAWRVVLPWFLILSFGAANAGNEPSSFSSNVEDPEWVETEAPPPPAFDVRKLVMFDVSINSSLAYGVDPATIRISASDGLVRYVVVAESKSGAKNVLYEALRCATGEYKTYARYTPDGKWSPVTQPQWKSMFGNMPSRHPLRLARAGGCENAAPPSSAASMISRMKTVNYGPNS